MSVIALEKQSDSLVLFVKGSPEIIQTLWESSTIPDSFENTLEKYTSEGLRVIAISYKFLDGFDSEKVKICKREEVETKMKFLGFIVMENKEKPETFSCVQVLQNADIPVIMATGDNGLTAISVGRKWGIIDPQKDTYLGDLDYNIDSQELLKWTRIKSKTQNEGSFISINKSDFKEKSNKIHSMPMPAEQDENGRFKN